MKMFCKGLKIPESYIIFVLFSPQTQFLAQFFSTQKRVNHSKKISTKQRKSPKTWFFNSLMRQNTINCTHHLSNLQIVFTFLTWRTLSTCQSVMWRISSSNNMLCGEISPHGRFFLHGNPWCPWQIWGVPMCQKRKYKNTNTQIQHITKCQKGPTFCYIFEKIKGIKNDITIIQIH